MKPFWIETKYDSIDYQIFYYQDLINYLNTQSLVILNFRENNVFKFFCNLVNSVINDKDLVLFDLTLNNEEILNLTGQNYVVETVEIEPISYELDVNIVLEKVFRSSSKITFFTSGTTGIPKKVTHSMRNLLREVRIGPNYSDYSWGYGYNPTHIAGIQLFFQALLNQNLMVNLFGRNRSSINYFLTLFKVTNIAATPSFFRMMMPFEMEYNSIIGITLGGEKSSLDLLDKIKKYFAKAKVNNVYASTEFGSILSSKNDYFAIKDSYRKYVKIENNTILVHKEILGENFDIRLMNDNWYDTGDLVEFIDDTKTLFRIIGRTNELINVGGEKVNPSEIEAKLLLFKEIKECRVYGIDNSVLGKIVAADIVFFENFYLDPIEIRQRLLFDFQSFKVPRKIYILHKLERGKTGKIKRK